jgi:hypothetical protein
MIPLAVQTRQVRSKGLPGFYSITCFTPSGPVTTCIQHTLLADNHMLADRWHDQAATDLQCAALNGSYVLACQRDSGSKPTAPLP